MEMRVEQLSAQADVSVDTIRYYQSKGLLDPPRREGRIAWYSEGHLDRLARIRSLQQRGFTLATIARLVSGELDAADEALLGQLTGVAPAAGGDGAPPPVPGDGSEDVCLDLDQLASVTGMPLALVKALEAEGLLIPTRVAGQPRYTEQDVAASRAGLRLLEWGIPLTDLLDLARRHNRATEATAREAVEMFARHIREPLRSGVRPDALETVGGHEALSDPTGDPAVDGLLQAYADLLPAVNTLVGHHFARTLVKVALDHVEREGSDEEREAVRDRIRTDGSGDAPHPRGTTVRSSR